MDRKAFTFESRATGDTGTFTGRASVYGNVDSYGDVVMPGAFTKTMRENGNRIVILNQHDPSDPIGMADLQDAADGLHCMGQLELDIQSARESFVRLSKGLVTGISIGYQTVKEAYAQGVRQLTEVRLFEISLVTFPANAAARVETVKNTGGALDELLSEVRAFNRELGQWKSANSDLVGRIRKLLDGMPIVGADATDELEALNAMMRFVLAGHPGIDDATAQQLIGRINELASEAARKVEEAQRVEKSRRWQAIHEEAVRSPRRRFL